jgi:predicted transcriptional regulator
MKDIDKFDLAEEQLKGFSRSAIRTKIMLCLMDNELSANELEKIMDTRTSTILHAMRELVDEKLAKKTLSGYMLTNIGKIEALILDGLVGAIVILGKHKDFWLEHDISGIPPTLLINIGTLGQSEMMTGNPAALLKAQEFFVETLKKSKRIQGLSPIIIPNYPDGIAAAVFNGADVELILTKEILNIVVREYYSMLQELLHQENFRLYQIDDDVKVAFTVTDSILSLGLFRTDGRYDLGNDLICTGEETVKWGRDLFDYYCNKSKLIKNI